MSLADLTPGERRQIRPAPTPRFVEPMKAVLTDERFSDPAWIFERKLDGIRCIAIKSNRNSWSSVSVTGLPGSYLSRMTRM